MAASSVREWIVESIDRIVSGETFTQEDFDAQPRIGWDEIDPKPGVLISSHREPHTLPGRRSDGGHRMMTSEPTTPSMPR